MLQELQRCSSHQRRCCTQVRVVGQVIIAPGIEPQYLFVHAEISPLKVLMKALLAATPSYLTAERGCIFCNILQHDCDKN